MRDPLKVLLLTSTFFLSGCQSPFLVFPGGSLSGDVVYVDSFEFASQFKLLQLETDSDPVYSVILRCTIIDGSLYVDAAQRRKWAEHLVHSNKVRIKLGELVYPAQAIESKDPNIKAQFFANRTVYEIRPISSPH